MIDGESGGVKLRGRISESGRRNLLQPLLLQFRDQTIEISEE